MDFIPHTLPEIPFQLPVHTSWGLFTHSSHSHPFCTTWICFLPPDLSLSSARPRKSQPPALPIPGSFSLFLLGNGAGLLLMSSTAINESPPAINGLSLLS